MNKAIRNRLIITLVLAVIAGLATYKYLNSLTEVTEIVVANQEIPPRTQITAEMLTTKTVHVDVLEVMPNLFTSPDEVVGFITRKKIPQGEPLRNSAEMLIRIKDDQVVLPDDGTIDRRFFIPSFKRAISISVDSEGAVGNTLRSGDLVDVIFTPRVSPGEEAFSVTLLQNVRVFDVAEIDSDKRGQKGTWQNITLLLSPQEAQDLALAKRYGFIDLTLVPEDAVPADLRPTFTGHILPSISPEEATPENKISGAL